MWFAPTLTTKLLAGVPLGSHLVAAAGQRPIVEEGWQRYCRAEAEGRGRGGTGNRGLERESFYHITSNVQKVFSKMIQWKGTSTADNTLPYKILTRCKSCFGHSCWWSHMICPEVPHLGSWSYSLPQEQLTHSPVEYIKYKRKRQRNTQVKTGKRIFFIHILASKQTPFHDLWVSWVWWFFTTIQ